MTTIYQALAAVMKGVQGVGKSGRNLDQGYNFRGVDAVVNAVGPQFREHGIVPTPFMSKAAYRDVQTSRGKPSRECTVTVTYRFYGPEGDYVDAEVPGESMDSGDKGTAKAMSVAYRIALLQVLCIPTDEPDPDQSSQERDWRPRETYAPPEPTLKDQVWAASKQKDPALTDDERKSWIRGEIAAQGKPETEALTALLEEWAA